MRPVDRLLVPAVLLAVVLSAAAVALAWSADRSAREADEREQLRAQQVHADGVLLRDEPTSDPQVSKTVLSSAVGVSNYGALPVEDVVVVGGAGGDDPVLAPQLRLGTLKPCEGEFVETDGRFGTQAVYFTDANGLRWRRAEGERPVRVAADEPRGLDATPRDVVRQELTGC